MYNLKPVPLDPPPKPKSKKEKYPFTDQDIVSMPYVKAFLANITWIKSELLFPRSCVAVGSVVILIGTTQKQSMKPSIPIRDPTGRNASIFTMLRAHFKVYVFRPSCRLCKL